MRRLQIASALAALAVVASAPYTLRAHDAPAAETSSSGMIQSLAEAGQGLAVLQRSPESGLAVFAAAKGEGILLPVAATDTAADRASVFVDLYGASFGLSDRSQVQLARAARRDALGLEHVRFQQIYQGVPVAGGEFLVHLKGTRVMAANGRVLEKMPDEMTPTVLPPGAAGVARQVVGRYEPEQAPSARYSEPRLEVLNRAFVEHSGSGPSRLAWFVEATAPGLRQFIWIDAQTGGLLLQFSQLEAAKNRRVYNAFGGSTLPGTLVRVEGGPPSSNGSVESAYTLSGVAYDFFFGSFGRDSFDGAGGMIISTVNFFDSVTCTDAQAFWNGTQLVYCSGAGYESSDDLVGHEFTHAVTQYEANLYSYVQSGALNESFSDIFGETIDLVQNVTGLDTPANRWKIGEDVAPGGLRDMMDPTTLFGQPGKVSDFQYWCDMDFDGGGVHVNSTVPSHAYALMVDGGTYNGYTVTGIGFTKAAQIHYRALSTYLTTSSGFVEDFSALNQSCSDMVGTAGITSADCSQVLNALLAVEIVQLIRLKRSGLRP